MIQETVYFLGINENLSGCYNNNNSLKKKKKVPKSAGLQLLNKMQLKMQLNKEAAQLCETLTVFPPAYSTATAHKLDETGVNRNLSPKTCYCWILVWGVEQLGNPVLEVLLSTKELQWH